MAHSPLVEAAALYLRLGLSVISLTGKTPNVTVHRTGLSNPIAGPVENEADWQLLADAFDHADTTGVGIVIPYPYVVVDIDGEEGAEQFQALFYDDIVETTWVAKTPRLPSGGLHFWFACTTPTGSMKLGSKLDMKGQLSYVAAPPSLHPDGGRYEWIVPPGADIKEVPEKLGKLIANHKLQAERRIGARVQRSPIRGPKYSEGDTVFYAQSGFDHIIDKFLNAEEGNRNNMLHWAAAVMAEEGADEDYFVQLDQAALKIGLDRVEVGRTLRSARRKFSA